MAKIGVILAAGRGSRMKSRLPKALQPLGGQPMISLLLQQASQVFDRLVLVVAPGMEDVSALCPEADIAIQSLPKGTGDAAKISSSCWTDEDEVAFLYADNPLLTSETMTKLIERRRLTGASLSLLTMDLEEPKAYGRVLLNSCNNVVKIVEYTDASEEERQIKLCNAGVICALGKDLRTWLSILPFHEKSQEFYLTDLIALAAESGKVVHVCGNEEELMGINDRQDLAQAEKNLQKKLRVSALKHGVTLQDPESVWLSPDTEFGRDVVIEPNVYIGPSVRLGDGVRIRAFSYLEDADIACEASIGPFSRLRGGVKCGEKSHVGNFVELKNTVLKQGVKAGHLSYLGDAEIGKETNIGAGTITCNFDGKNKFQTLIGDQAFIGSNSALVAPVKIGNKVIVAAGSTITEDVPDLTLAFGRSRQVNHKKAAERWWQKFIPTSRSDEKIKGE
ncbi:bifunctional UDP-N-acetylglucosamine diphosphorylase/glucosamine-1-phosphate N-acetyltransferase GlmU [Acetobacteraceae bacterium]|nr:bifunctional UDP-N-acetylglucosamine diphosphorylase/glucosamine-1-phosphate N-acetyltransferase GlmU [Acetobacteraceae bacterium]